MYPKLLTTILAFTATSAAADWRAAEVDPAAYPPEIVAETQAPVSSVTEAGLPDGLVATGAGDIAAAWYEGPTRRYAHGILGDAVEAGSLVVEAANGARAVFDLPESHVYEDRAPRIADLDGDGRAEVIAIRSSQSGGGGVVVYGLREGRVTELASIPDIGTPNRWLNIAAIADLNGDGLKEIAFVRTPHIGGTLRIFGWRDGGLRLLDEVWGFSNHAIGAREMRLSALWDADGDGQPELAVPDAARRALNVVRLEGETLVEVASVPLPGRIDKAVGVEDGFVVGIDDGRVFRVAP